MRKHKSKNLPPFIPEDQLSPFVERGIQISKATLIERVAGKLEYSAFYFLKILQFHEITKDNEGRLSMF